MVYSSNDPSFRGRRLRTDITFIVAASEAVAWTAVAHGS
jgi:hypothetical protein